jgi:hypothetical protein
MKSTYQRFEAVVMVTIAIAFVAVCIAIKYKLSPEPAPIINKRVEELDRRDAERNGGAT